ncbi:MAG: hypothetical protein OSJ70_04905 [Bacilli bacterium]|nr:hypothetical protein [Bacilli bacterium]
MKSLKKRIKDLTILALLNRNHRLFNKNMIQKRLLLSLIRDDDTALRRSQEAVKYIDSLENTSEEVKKIREILTCFKTNNILDEVNYEKAE